MVFCVDSLSSSESLQIYWGSVVVAEHIRRGRSQSCDWNQSCMATWVAAMKPCSITELKQVACLQKCVLFRHRVNTSVLLMFNYNSAGNKKVVLLIHVELCHYTTLDWRGGETGHLIPVTIFTLLSWVIQTVIQHCDTAEQSQLDQAVNRVSGLWWPSIWSPSWLHLSQH